MKIALDAMGGDNAPGPNIDGAILAIDPDSRENISRKHNIEIVLVGKKDIIKKELISRGAQTLPLEIHDASEVIAMDEPPIEACTKKTGSSIIIGVNLLRDGKVDAFVSAGNSGAIMAAAAINLKRIRGVRRPVIASSFPTLEEPCVILDVGANAECKPKHLFQFATMGEAYVKYVFKRRIPRVALLSMGREEGKGNRLVQDTYQMLLKSDLNFIGNIEGNDILKGIADVIVCDGFVGNIVLKFGESVARSMLELLRQEVEKSTIRKIGAGIMRGAFRDIRKKIDYEEVGGALLLGVTGTCIISHGVSNAKAIKNSINTAAEFVEQDVNKHIENAINKGGLMLK
ncbi:MAG: phosphate acyltransferase PlsX [Elusimicrobia bacterium]|nr:phosphate acyltransferase PlsX [Elusimicrobiota bacterium]